MKILHIHQDYPDDFPYPSTQAVSNLIESCRTREKKVDHYVLSINRTSNPFKTKVAPFKDGLAVIYWSIPLPYLYTFSLWLSARLLCKHVDRLEFDLIHGHKMTTEGGIAYFLSRYLKLPYILSVRGGSDTHNLSRLSVHKAFFAKVYNGASNIFWVSPWAKKAVESCLNKPIKPLTLLPNICIIDLKDKVLSVSKRANYITAIAFHQYKRKGLIPLINAISVLGEKGVNICLDIYGDGPQSDIDSVKAEISKLKLGNQIFLKGKVSQEELREKMSQSKAFLMPSINETFGMSYIEALSVGCPIVYMSDTGIDGYFDDYDVGVKLVGQSVDGLVKSFENLEENSQEMVNSINQMNEKKYLEMFTGQSVANLYLSVVAPQFMSVSEEM